MSEECRSWVQLTFEIPGKCQRKSHAHTVLPAVNSLPGTDENNGLGCITPRSLQDTIYVLARVSPSSSAVCVALAANLDTKTLENLLDVVVYPATLVRDNPWKLIKQTQASATHSWVSLPLRAATSSL